MPGAIEMMDKLAIEASEQMAHAGYPVGRGAALLIELDGAERECEARFDEVVEICEKCGSDDVRVAKDEAERAAVLEDAQGGVPRDGPHLPQLLRPGRRDPAHEAARGARAPRRARPRSTGCSVANVFHAGDGNLHPLVCYDGRKEGEAERAEELSGLILDACLEAGGSITGEHGVGVDKKKHMPKMFDEPDLAAFQRLRCAFDPAGLANPGKVMPTPRLCGEVPGPVPDPPAGSRRARREVLSVATAEVTTERPGSPEEAAELLRVARRGRAAPCARAAAARSSTGAGSASRSRSSSRPAGWRRSSSTTRAT